MYGLKRGEEPARRKIDTRRFDKRAEYAERRPATECESKMQRHRACLTPLETAWANAKRAACRKWKKVNSQLRLRRPAPEGLKFQSKTLKLPKLSQYVVYKDGNKKFWARVRRFSVNNEKSPSAVWIGLDPRTHAVWCAGKMPKPLRPGAAPEPKRFLAVPIEAIFQTATKSGQTKKFDSRDVPDRWYV